MIRYYCFDVSQTSELDKCDILSCVFPLLEIRYPVGIKPGSAGLRGDCSHCLTSHKLFKFEFSMNYT